MQKYILLALAILVLTAAHVWTAPKQRPCRDSINGRGAVPTSGANGVGRFVLRATSVDGQLRGWVRYVERTEQRRVVSRELVEYVVTDDVSRRLKFIVRDSEGLPSEIIVLACDLGRRRTEDLLEIYFPDTSSAGGHLLRGGVRLRVRNCGTAP